MGKLIIDGNSVFEIDEECVKKRKNVPKSCDIDKYIKNMEVKSIENFEPSMNMKKS